MLSVIECVFIGIFILILVPVTTFFLQIVLSLLPYKRRQAKLVKPAKVAILIPAHNESSGLIPTLESIQAQIDTKQESMAIKVLVVADNCNDDTAKIAKSHGVEVVERFNQTLRGKGYALDFGLQHLAADAPDIVLILDADCLLGARAIETLVEQAITYQRPIQGLYLMYSKSDSPLKTRIAEFAWTVKNWARPLGYHRLGLPCQLMGSGMAFPWQAIRQVNLASGHIVEDMKLGVDLAKLNLAPRFCPEALITSQFPSSEEGIKTQRTRWEHGHIGMILKEGPLLILQSFRHGNINMLALALDMCVPPLALLVLLIVALSTISAGLMLVTAQWLPWAFAWAALLLVGLAVLLAWAKFGRAILAFSVLLMAPVYVLVKIPLYIKFIYKRQSEWVRSKRDS